MNIFRRLPLSRLLLLCGLVVAVGVSATALASAVSYCTVTVTVAVVRPNSFVAFNV